MKDTILLPDVVVRFILQYIDNWIRKLSIPENGVSTATQQVLGRIDQGEVLPECIMQMIDGNKGDSTRLEYLYINHSFFRDAHSSNMPKYINNIENLVDEDGFYDM